MPKRRTFNKDMKNKKMNSSVYALRRKVINIIYEAKKLVDLPRVEVRITEADTTNPRTLAQAALGDRVVWVAEKTVKNYTPTQLRHVVFHELLHAVFGTRHVDGCKLMGAFLTKTTKAEQNKLFKKYANA